MKTIKTLLVNASFIGATLLAAHSVSAASFTLLTEELPPYSMKKGSDATGASVEIVQELFRRAKLDFSVRIVPWKRAYETAKDQDNSCVFPVQRSQEREALFHWVSPVLVSQTAFYTTESSSLNIRTINDVKDLRIGSYNGSAAADYLTGQGYQVATTPTDAPNVQKLARDRLDVWAADTLTAHHLAKEAGVTNLKEQLVYFTTLRGLACNLGVSSEVIDTLNDELKKMYVDKTVDGIMAKYR